MTRHEIKLNEQALAGCLLHCGKLAVDRIKYLELTGDYFTDATCRKVFNACQTLLANEKPLETKLIMETADITPQAAGQLIDDAALLSDIFFHAEQIEADHFKRKSISDLQKTEGLTAFKLALKRVEATLPQEQDAADSVAIVGTDWLDEPDEPDRPILHGLIDCGDRVAIVGQSKARKSFYALQLALSIATGRQFLGFTTERQRVLIVNGEIKAAAYKKRLRRMIEKLGITPDELGDLLVVNASETADAGGFDEILLMVTKLNAGVVIIDPAYLLLGDEIDQTQVKQSIFEMKRFGAQGITLVLVYHATKGKIGDRQAIDRISGSGIFARDASTILTLCEHAAEADGVVVTAIARNHAPIEPITALFNEGAFTLSAIAAVEKTSMTKATRTFSDDAVLGAFTVGDPLRYKDAISAIQQRVGVGVNKAKELLAKLADTGLLTITKEGRDVFYEVK